ncbi:TetR/AcrR family transcriptional regulator [Microbacterium halophytorum]|uniref:TetR/AcrR family transcriptional regulator n=1 Tax=Microbacterium halophytorum TaxID=2067568 RepID=UPI000CFC341D|nr:TetR family transcriptional regulator [Microbacterium halophytorum]
MGRTAGRGADETRRVILDAATSLVARRGHEVPLADVAEAAGVSKGGLLYHFPTKDDLFAAGATRLFERFRASVFAEASREPAGEPGRLARAYIRVSFADAVGDDTREMIAVAAQLMNVAAVRELSEADGRRWRDDLMGDGLAPATVRLVVAATDGVSAAPLWGAVLAEADAEALERDLLEATRRP